MNAKRNLAIIASFEKTIEEFRAAGMVPPAASVKWIDPLSRPINGRLGTNSQSRPPSQTQTSRPGDGVFAPPPPPSQYQQTQSQNRMNHMPSPPAPQQPGNLLANPNMPSPTGSTATSALNVPQSASSPSWNWPAAPPSNNGISPQSQYRQLYPNHSVEGLIFTASPTSPASNASADPPSADHTATAAALMAAGMPDNFIEFDNLWPFIATGIGEGGSTEAMSYMGNGNGNGNDIPGFVPGSSVFEPVNLL